MKIRNSLHIILLTIILVGCGQMNVTDTDSSQEAATDSAVIPRDNVIPSEDVVSPDVQILPDTAADAVPETSNPQDSGSDVVDVADASQDTGNDTSSDAPTDSLSTDVLVDSMVADRADAVADTGSDVVSEETGMLCPSGQQFCSGVCMTLHPGDNANCGACGNTCGGHSCQWNGANIAGCVCGSTPPPVRMLYSCFGTCGIRLDIDNNNCGYCGHVCPTSTMCVDGLCM